MIKSMTGYGRSQQIIDGREITVEIKSVNHRYFEFSARVPRAYGYLEEKLKTHIQNKVSRGKVDVGVTVFNIEGKDAQIEVNHSIATGYVDALRKANETIGLTDDLALSQLIKLPDIFNVVKTTEDEEIIWNLVKTVAEEALDNFVSMRETEGQKMKEDIKSRLSYISELVGKVETRSPLVTEAYRERLYNKISEILNDKKIDEQRILTEAAIFSEKTAVDEETVRLKSHIQQFTVLLDSTEAVGRKLDFLIQEFNRESNTIGSKAQDVEITRIVVELKSEIEKIREQIQNIE
ncbi:MAG: YicC family protein [Oscillospiraceae bacterium]|nr:YicC family protein [Oscillospiraceae bacterium]